MLASLLPFIKSELFPRLQTIYTLLLSSLFGNTGTPNEKTNFFQEICKIEEIRKKAFGLLSTIAIKEKIETEILQILMPFHLTAKWRANDVSSWHIEATQFTKSQTGYVGLVNMGFTCYVNSLIQQLYFIPEFRNTLISMKNVGKSGTIIREIQQVFGVLNEKLYASYQPKMLCESMKVDPTVQRDASEFLDSLFEQLKEALKQTEQKGLISSLFEIPIASETICLECHTRCERISPPAYAIHIEVKNKKNILESLKTYVAPETMEGDNAYYCSKCEKKVSAKKRELFKVLPNILIIHLKRFDFNFDFTTKLNSYCEFPMELDMEEFSGTDNNVKNEKLPKPYYKYKLQGIIAHSGMLNSGHYYSFIEDTERMPENGESRWFEFNDVDVKPFNVKDISDKAFGYKEEQSKDSSIPNEWMLKSNNAYILMYKRSVMLGPEVLTKIITGDDNEHVKQKIECLENAQLMPNDTTIISEELRNILDEERNNKLVQQIFFHPEYAKFILRLMKNPGMEKDRVRKEYISNQLFLLTYFFTTAIRGNGIEEINELLAIIKVNCKKEIGLCKAIAALFSNQHILKEFIFNCPKGEATVFVVGLLKFVIQKLYTEEQEIIEKFYSGYEYLKINSKKTNGIPFFVLMIDAFILGAGNITKKNCGQYFHILSCVANLGEGPKKYLTFCLLPGIILDTLGISGKNDCTKSAVESLPHFCGSTELFFRILIEDKSSAEQTQVNTKIIPYCEYSFQLLSDLLKNSLEIGKDIGSRMPKFADLLKNSLQSLKLDTTLHQLFDLANSSKKALNNLSTILQQLCELKYDIYGSAILTYLNFKLNDARVKDLRLFLQPAFYILQSKDKTLASVFILIYICFIRLHFKQFLVNFTVK